MKKRLLIAAIALAALCVALALSPRAARFETYTSPVYPYGDIQYRFQIRVPVGWGVRGRNMAGAQPLVLEPLPDRRFNWLPHWLRKLLVKEPLIGGNVLLFSGPIVTSSGIAARDGQVHIDHVGNSTGLAERIAFRITADPPHATVLYQNPNTEEFDATYRQICESFKVIP